MGMNLKLYIVSHKKTFVPNCRYLVPIQVGCDMARELFDGYMHDNEGDNISSKNPDYCELTALYWIWKNDMSDYVGLFHYRRYLALNNNGLVSYMNDFKQFYRVEALTQKNFEFLGYFDEDAVARIKDYDIIMPKCSVLEWRNISDFYSLYKKSYGRELDYAFSILKKDKPEYEPAIKECMCSRFGYHCNMFIMKRAVLDEYCEWLFPVLDSMYADIQLGSFSTDKKRLMGYLAEFLFGVFVCHKRNTLVIGELPGVFFVNTDGKSHLLQAAVSHVSHAAFRLAVPLGSRRERFFYRILDTCREGKEK